MQFQAFIDDLSDITVINPEKLADQANQEVTVVTNDSRKATSGAVFVALSGSQTDGHLYASKAIESGALAVVVQAGHPVQFPPEHNTIILESPNTYRAFAAFNGKFYGNPTANMRLVGVTGTNGKTTVTHLIERILADAGKPVGLIGTLGTRSGGSGQAGKTSESKEDYQSLGNTTPLAHDLQRTLANLRDGGSKFVVMEVSSHALEQDRVYGCDFEVAVMTNVTQDHLDYHLTMENYCAAKAKLFSGLGPAEGKPSRSAVINLDDPWAKVFVEAMPSGIQTFTYSLNDQAAAIRAKDVSFGIEGAKFTVITPDGEAPVNLKIAGEFSVYNALAALAAGLALGLPLAQCVQSLEQVPGIRGRFEVVSENPYVIVDYAHTPDGLENVLSAARMITPKDARLIAVFGCGGDRDATKRPKMGGIAERLADVLVVTSDNPRTEDPQQIITDVLTGIQRFDANTMTVQPDREKAIHQAIDMAQPNDIIVVAGKGHEDYQILADRTIHFDDKEIVQAYVARKQTTVQG